MKNAIKYYYGLDVENIKYFNNNYYFDKYILENIYSDIDINLYNKMIQNNIPVYRIINNIFNTYITNIDDKMYILLYKNFSFDKKLSFSSVINSYYIDNDNINSWDKLWESKIDYFEKNIININNKKILSIYPYYIGLSELAVRIYKESNYNTNKCISHKRLESSDDLFIPSNIIIDYRVRDIAEYIKYNFFFNNIDINNLYYELDNSNLNQSDFYLLFVRLLFPSYFYDCIEKNNDITIYLSRINQYESFLNKIYNYISLKVKLPKIEWLIKNSID